MGTEVMSNWTIISIYMGKHECVHVARAVMHSVIDVFVPILWLHPQWDKHIIAY